MVQRSAAAHGVAGERRALHGAVCVSGCAPAPRRHRRPHDRVPLSGGRRRSVQRRTPARGRHPRREVRAPAQSQPPGTRTRACMADRASRAGGISRLA